MQVAECCLGLCLGVHAMLEVERLEVIVKAPGMHRRLPPCGREAAASFQDVFVIELPGLRMPPNLNLQNYTARSWSHQRRPGLYRLTAVTGLHASGCRKSPVVRLLEPMVCHSTPARRCGLIH